MAWPAACMRCVWPRQLSMALLAGLSPSTCDSHLQMDTSWQPGSAHEQPQGGRCSGKVRNHGRDVPHWAHMLGTLALLPSVVGSRCALVYVDVGSNRGDSIEAFVRGKPEARVAAALKSAWPEWLPAQSCVFGFEPNPRWAPRLRATQVQLAPRVMSIDIRTDTIVMSSAKPTPLYLDLGACRDAYCESAHLTERRGTNTTGALKQVNLARFLREEVALLVGSAPVVVRLDVEGAEYSILADLATSGVGRSLHVFVAVEWHRHAKTRLISAEERTYMQALDDEFRRYVLRGPGGSATSNPPSRYSLRIAAAANSSLEGSLEKVLVYMLHRAGITYVDSYFEDLGKQMGNKRHRRTGRRQTPRTRPWN